MTTADTAAWLRSRDRLCILTHCRPDGDTTGSAAALCLGLRKLGKTAHILANPELNGKLAFLHEGLTKEVPEEGDTVVAVDTSARCRLQRGAEALPVDLRIDHHGVGTPFADRELVDASAAACGQIIYRIFREWGLALDPQTGLALYVAVSTDTGCFRFSNTAAESFQVAAACVEAGAQIYPVNQALFDTVSRKKLQLQGWMAENARFYREGRLALCAMPKEVEEGATEDDLDNIAGSLRSIEGVELCALLREAEGGVKLSVRCVPGYDAAAVCARFGGGGHKGASGATMDMDLAQAAQAVEAVLLELYGG